MPLDLDPSTPARVTASATSISTAAFSPPSGSFLLALVMADENNAFPPVSGGGLTWTKIDGLEDTGAVVNQAAFWAYAAAAPGSMTVTAMRSGDWDGIMLQVAVFTGAETSFTGASGHASGRATVTYEATADGSWAWAGFGDEGSGGDTPVSGCEWYADEITWGGGIGGGGYLRRTSADGVSGTDTSIGATNNFNTSCLAVEVKPAAGGGGHSGNGTALTLGMNYGDGVGSGEEHASGTGGALNVAVAYATGVGAPAVAGDGAALPLVASYEQGIGAAAITGDGAALDLATSYGTGQGTSGQAAAGTGLTLGLTLGYGDGVGMATERAMSGGQPLTLAASYSTGTGTPSIAAGAASLQLAVTYGTGGQQQPRDITILAVGAPESHWAVTEPTRRASLSAGEPHSNWATTPPESRWTATEPTRRNPA